MTMNKTIYISIGFLIPLFVNAEEVLAGFDTFNNFLEWLFKFGFGVAVILSVLMIVIGGIEYIFSAVNVEKRSDAKKRINQAIFGLLLAAMSWLILYTINPDLTKNVLNIESVDVGGPGDQQDGELPPGDKPPLDGEWTSILADDNKTRNFLKENFIFINKGACPTSYKDTNCTMVSELPQNAIDGVIKIKKDSGASITITGGTEIGVHKSHGPNNPILDLRFNSTLLQYMHDKVGLGIGTKMEYDKIYNANDGSFGVIREINKDGVEHFHVVFK